MKALLTGAALAAAALCLSACTTANQTAMAPIVDAIAQNIQYCHVTGSFQAGAGGIAGTGTGVAASNTFDCPAQARASTPAAPTASTTSAAPAATK